MYDLHGKVALITGASSGIGAATAVYFSSFGAKLSLTGRNEKNLNLVSADCVRARPAEAEDPLIVVADLNSEADVARLVDTTIKKFGRLDILVNNAGILELGSIETTSMEQYDRLMKVNMRAVYQLTMLCVPHLIATRGNIVNVSSVGGTRSFPGALVFCMAKAALDQMTSCTALELASKGVRVNSVNPGRIHTNLFHRSGLSDEACAELLERAKDVQPLGRIGNAEEVAQAIAFLASSNASFITGEHLHIDGGRHSTCDR